jgi:hypothetical protein
MIDLQALLRTLPLESLYTIKWLIKKRPNINDTAPYNITVGEQLMQLILTEQQHHSNILEIIRTLVHPSNKSKTKHKLAKKEYTKLVRNLTKLQPINTLQNYDKLKCIEYKHFSSEEHYVIDHKISISYGYKHDIPPENISHITNLRWIPSKENRIKNINNFVDDSNSWILV